MIWEGLIVSKPKNAKKNPAKGQATKFEMDPDEFVKICNERDDGVFSSFLEGTKPGAEVSVRGFSAMLAVESLIQQEVRILQLEMPDGGYFGKEQLPEEIRRYVKMRQEAKEALGPQFKEFYEMGRKGHNDCARKGLDGSDGSAYYFVLPKFNDDGSHEPPGPRDIPWNVKESKRA